jgi:hypothetical protein
MVFLGYQLVKSNLFAVSRKSSSVWRLIFFLVAFLLVQSITSLCVLLDTNFGDKTRGFETANLIIYSLRGVINAAAWLLSPCLFARWFGEAGSHDRLDDVDISNYLTATRQSAAVRSARPASGFASAASGGRSRAASSSRTRDGLRRGLLGAGDGKSSAGYGAVSGGIVGGIVEESTDDLEPEEESDGPDVAVHRPKPSSAASPPPAAARGRPLSITTPGLKGPPPGSPSQPTNVVSPQTPLSRSNSASGVGGTPPVRLKLAQSNSVSAAADPSSPAAHRPGKGRLNLKREHTGSRSKIYRQTVATSESPAEPSAGGAADRGSSAEKKAQKERKKGRLRIRDA